MPPDSHRRVQDEHRDEFLKRLDDLIEYTRAHSFRGATQAHRALVRVRGLAALKRVR